MRAFKLKKQEPKESQIQAAVCEYLAIRKHFFWRSNNTPIFQSDGKGGGFFRSMNKYTMKGVPDIIVVTEGGYVVFLEIKRPSGKQSDEQRIFENRAKAKGAEYYIIKSVDQVQEIGL